MGKQESLNILSFIMVFGLLSTIHCACAVSCTGGSFCDGTTCKFLNDETNTCTTLDDCFDTVFGVCDTTCKCMNGYTWHASSKRCLLISDGTMPCTSDYDCTFGGGSCIYGKCRCILNYKYSASSKSCNYDFSVKNNNDTNCTYNSCFDMVRGYCNIFYCLCTPPYKWTSTRLKCGIQNNGTACLSNDQCMDELNGGCINSACVCNSPYIWYPTSGKCAFPNDGTYSCDSDYDCGTDGYCIVGKCICTSYYRWSAAAKKCFSPYSNSGSACSSTMECVDTIRGGCISGICKCNTGFTYDSSHRACVKRNLGSPFSCIDASECVDKKVGICSNGFCACPSGYVFSSECKKPNNGISDCVLSSECYDISNGGCIRGKCVCFTYQSGDGCYSYSPKFANDNKKACSSISNCRDQIYGECRINCTCKTDYVYRNYKCLKLNDGLGTCTSSAECLVNDYTGSCFGGVCTCYGSWNDPYCSDLTENGYSCTSIADCFEKINGGCYTQGATKTCQCNAFYIWNYYKQRCLKPNNGTATCYTATDCSDNFFGDCISGVCVCKSGYYWSSSSSFYCYQVTVSSSSLSDFGGSCSVVADCKDSVNGLCSGTCYCPFGFSWSNEIKKCLIMNDGIFSCTSTSDCFDSVNGLCSSTCICNPSFTWSYMSKKCGFPNDGISICTQNSDCLDVTKGMCYNGKCVCWSGTWNVLNNYCTLTNLIENTNSGTCTYDNQCMDSFNGLCRGRCQCKYGYVFLSDYKRCGKPNDNVTTCSMPLDCIDNIYGACYDGICICKPPTVPHPSGECRFLNDGVSGGTSYRCYVFDSSAVTSLVCSCRAKHRWLPLNKTCFLMKHNDGIQPCEDSSECFDMENGGCVSGYCKCYNNLSWSLQLLACRSPNNNSGSCVVTADCVDVTNGVCNENKVCTCVDSIWVKSKMKCTNCLIGTYASPPDFACLPCSRLCSKCKTNAINCQECNSDVTNLNLFQGSSCTCKDGFYNDLSKTLPAEYCQPCGRTCYTCIDNPDSCLACKLINGIIKLNGVCLCPPRYYLTFNTTKQKDECVACHPLCTKCDGYLNTQCDECDRNLDAILVPYRTCTCPTHYYYDTNQNRCIQCHSYCIECFGFSPDKCYGCDTLISFNVNDKPNLCTEDCYQLDGYFLRSKTCYPCHNDCKKCVGPSNSECIMCRRLDKVNMKGSCLNECLTHYYPIDRICYECHSTCLNCSNGTRFNCTNCDSGLRLWNSQCVYPCPPRTYEKGNTCANCKSPCETCISDTECITCLDEFYKVVGTHRCVGENDCPLGTFPDKSTKSCEKCYYTCLTCNGPQNKDCIKCNFTGGFGRPFGQVGECYSLICYDGMFLEINFALSLAKCQKCHSSCRTCDNSDPNNCIQCKPDLTTANSPLPNRVRCLTCSDVNKGYIDTAQGCKEVCGDGVNLGQVECDDGNNLNGDGCSSTCKIEEGFKCLTGFEAPDQCTDIKSPEAKLYVKRADVLEIIFNEPVSSSVSSEQLIKSFRIDLEGARSECQLSFSSNTRFSPGSIFNKIILQAKVTCSLRGKAERFTMSFTNTSLISDLAGNKLKTISISAEAKRYVYISDEQKAAVEGSGATFSASSLAVLGVTLAINSLQSAAIGSFWDFVNMLQVISYASVISCEIPSNLKIFLTNYLTVSKVSIPFSLLPSNVINPFSLFSIFSLDKVAGQFIEGGYDSYSFIYNLSDEISTWLLLLFTYFVIRIIIKFLPETKCTFLRKWKKDYEYNALIRIQIESFISLTFCAILNIWMVMKKISLFSLITIR